MKNVILIAGLTMIFSALSFADEAKTETGKQYSCQKYAEAVAVNWMNDGLKDEVKPRKLSDAEQAYVTQTNFLDKNGDQTDTETGIYEVEMGVMEECLDSAKVTTKVITVKGKQRCKLIKVESLGQRECG